MKKSFPDGIDYAIAMDTTQFTRASIETVVHTFFEALVLVVLVVFLFLQSFRATLIPIIAVPISIVGAAIGMTALGFSINMLTLFGMVLAIGIVVDDAIVVIESVEHNMSKFGMSPEGGREEVDGRGRRGAGRHRARACARCSCRSRSCRASRGSCTSSSPSRSRSSVVISGIVALTLSPALAALLLKPAHHEKKGFFRWFENAFARMTVGYTRVVKLMIKRSLVALLLFAGMIAICAQLFRTIPSSFLPPEDQGYLLGAVIMPDAASLDRTGRRKPPRDGLLHEEPGIEGGRRRSTVSACSTGR